MPKKKSFLKLAFSFLAYGNIFVSLSAVSLAAYAIQVMDYKLDFFILFTIFFATLFGYSFQRKISILNSKTPTPSAQNTWIKKNLYINNAIIIVSFVACFYFLYQLPAESFILIAPLATLSLFYVLRIGNWPALRSIPFLKVFVVAFVWGGVIVLLPAFYESDSLELVFTLKKQFLCFSLAFFVFGQSLPFDIRDMYVDKKANLQTIPHKIGIQMTLRICWISLGVAMLISITSYLVGFISWVESTSFVLALLSTSALLIYYKKPRPPLYYSIVLEACLMLPLLYYHLILWFL